MASTKASMARSSQASTTASPVGVQVDRAQHLVAAPRDAQLQRQLDLLAVERELDGRALADDHAVLEEVDLGRQGHPPIAILVRAADVRAQGLQRLGIGSEGGATLPGAGRLDVAEGLAVLHQPLDHVGLARERRLQAERPQSDPSVERRSGRSPAASVS